VADLPQVTPNLHRLTALRIGDSTGIGADRLVIAATHVHAGPGHFYAERQYNQSTSQVEGYDSAMVEFLVSRFARAVLDAQRDLRPARVAWGATAVWGHTRNRSYEAFLRDKPEWTPPAPVTPGLDPTHRAVNPLWTLLRVDQRGRGADSAYRPAGAFSVFAVHGTADAPENELLDAGIHGIIERGLERHVDSLSGRGTGYHLVANGAEGDVSPDWAARRTAAPVCTTGACSGSSRSGSRRVGTPSVPTRAIASARNAWLWAGCSASSSSGRTACRRSPSSRWSAWAICCLASCRRR